MKRLFLASNLYITLPLLLPNLHKTPDQLRLAFVPTASDPEPDPSYMDLDLEALRLAGFRPETIDIKGKSFSELQAQFQGIDIIFVAGGNTFYLLQETIHSGFDRLVRELVNQGVWYLGSSAGAVLAAPDIKAIEGLDDRSFAPKLVSTKALGLVDFLVLPHWGRDKYKEVYIKTMESIYLDDLKLIPLLDTQAVMVTNDVYKIVQIPDKSQLAVYTYNYIADVYTDRYFNDLSDADFIDQFLSQLPERAKVLDLGSGPGQFADYMHQKGYQVTAIDFSEQMVKIANQKVPHIPVTHMDMRKLKFADDSFDGLLAAYSLIHIQTEELRTTLKGFNRVLKPGGLMLLITQKGEPDQTVDEPFMPSKKMFVNFFTKERLNKYINMADLEVISQEERATSDPDAMSETVIYTIVRKTG